MQGPLPFITKTLEKLVLEGSHPLLLLMVSSAERWKALGEKGA